MRVFLDADPLCFHPCGISVYLVALLDAIGRLDSTVTFHAAHPTIAPRRLRGVRELIARHGLPLEYQWIPLPGRLAACLPPSVKRLLFRTLATADVQHATEFLPPTWWPQHPRRQIISVYDVAFFRDPRHYPAAFATRLREELPRAATQAAAVLTISEFSKREIVRFCGCPPETVFVTPLATQFHGVVPASRDVLERHHLQPGRYFLSVGTISPRKNFATLLAAFDAVRTTMPEAVLVIVGRHGWEAEDVLRRLRAGEPHLRWINGCPTADLRTLYQHARGAFMVSWYEGFGIPVLEAMEHGCPICYATGSAMDEVADAAGIAVRPQDTAAIATAFQRLWTDDALCEQQRQAGLAQARRFSWDRTAAETLAVYQAVAAGRFDRTQ